MFEVYETEKTLYLVTEYEPIFYSRLCEGGELFYHITKSQHLTEC